MIPVLYTHAEKQFNTNGLGRLTDCISCVVTEERNGEFKCEFEYPTNGQHFDDIREGCIIYVTHDNSGIPQPFDIYSRSVPIDGVVTFQAAHISYRLGNVVLKPFTATSCASTLASIPNAAMNECEFEFITDKNVNADFELRYPVQAKAILCGMQGSVLDVYGTGEYKYEDFQVRLYLHRGVDTDVQIRYGKNIVDMTDVFDSSNSYNAVVPYWISPENGELVTLPEYAVIADNAVEYLDFWTDENGEYITDENDERFEFDYVALKPVTLDLSAVFETKPTLDQMRAKAKASANDHAIPSRTIRVDFVQLWQSEEYASFAPLQQLNLCDTATVVYPNVSVRLKVVRTEYDVLRDRYTGLELGQPPESYADVITGEINDKLNIVPSKVQMQAAITDATQKITGVQGGNVVILQEEGRPQEILIMDTPDMETAVHVLRINMNGIGFSETGVNGEYKTAWTLDGEFVASFITTGFLSSNRIKGGAIYAEDGLSYWNLEDAAFLNSNADGKQYLYMRGGHFSLHNTYTGSDITTFALGSYVDGTGTSFEGHYIDVSNANKLSVNGNISMDVEPTTRFINEVYLNTSDHYIGGYATIGGYAYKHITISSDNLVFAGRGHGNVPSNYSYYAMLVLTSQMTYFQSGISASSVEQRSDEKLKNIYEYPEEYDAVIDELEPIAYKWKDSDDKNEHVGLGARKTKAILNSHGLKEAGFSVDVGDVYSINYNELTVMLLKRVQDLTKRVEELEGIINANSSVTRV